ncbi:MAG: nickel/cobalt transporter [Actinomycetota bacterium]
MRGAAIRRSLAAAAIVATVALGPAAPAAAHPLGNFTVNVYGGVIVRPDAVVVDYVVDMAEIPAFGARREIDENLDERIDERESLAYREATCADLADGITVRVDGRPVTVTATEVHDLSFPAGAGGLSTLRLECRLTAGAPAIVTEVELSYEDRNFPDTIGWREVTAIGDGVTLAGSEVPEISPTGRLASYPDADLPLDTRVATFAARPGGPELASMPGPDGSGTTDALPAIAGRDAGPLAGLVGAQDLTPLLVAAMVGVAFGVGALHALGPGHGKALIGAYLVGAGGSLRHAVGVGAAVSVMHTASVLVLGLLVLSAERTLAPERVYPLLGLASGLIALGLGSALLVSRIHAAAHDRRHRTRGHRHGHGHEHPHDGNRAGSTAHLSRRGLMALAFSGGILPSPSALVTLLAAVSLGRTALGMLLIAAFSVGLAASLIGVGVVTLQARDVAERRLSDRAALLLPVASSAAIAAMGLFLTVRGAAQL